MKRTDLGTGEILDIASASREIDKAARQSSSLTTKAERLEIKSQKDYAEAGLLLSHIHAQLKRFKLDAKEVVDPVYRAYKILQKRAKERAAPYEAAKQAVRDAMLQWDREQDVKALKAAEKEAKALRKEGAEEAAQDAIELATMRPNTPKISTVSIRERWVHEVVDLEKVPAGWTLIDGTFVELRPVDDAAVRKVIRDGARDGDIPGIRIFKKKLVAAR